MKKSLLGVLISTLLLATAAAAGCTSTPSPNATATSTTSPALQLEGTTWTLTSLATETGMNNTLPTTTITAQFDDGNVTGSSGCNRYFGSYQVNKTEIKIGQVGSTLMFCTDPDGIMTQESSYVLLLKNATSYAISINELTLSDSLGNPQLVFEAALNNTTVTATSWPRFNDALLSLSGLAPAFTGSLSNSRIPHQVAAKAYGPQNRWISDPSFRPTVANSRKDGVSVPVDNDKRETG
jgi:heat shock protein HslJ